MLASRPSGAPIDRLRARPDDGRMPILRRLLLCLLLAGFPTLHAQDAPAGSATPAISPAQTLDGLRDQLDGIKAALKNKPDDHALADLRTTALAVQDQAEQLAATLAPQMDSLDARLAVLGPAPAKGAPPEAAEVAGQRRQLDKAKANLDAQIKQAQLLGEEGMQLATQVYGLRRDQFQAQLASRTATPLGATFWADPARSLPDDLARLKRLRAHVADAWHDAWQPPNRLPLLLCLGAALLLVAGRLVLERVLYVLAARAMPDGHLRRSATAVGIALASVLVYGLAAQFVRTGLDWNGTLDPGMDELARSLVRRVCFAAFVAGLGRALLSVAHPTWRLPTLSNAAARRLRLFPGLLAAATLLLGVVDRINSAIGASLPATVTTRGLVALVVSGLVGIALLRLDHARRALLAAGSAPAQRPLWVGLLAGAAALGAALSWIAVVLGYIALAYFIATRMLWIGVLIGALYLMLHLVHDLIATLLAPDGRSGQRLQTAFGLPPRTLEQAATVLSGISRVLILLLAIGALLAPFGTDPQELVARMGQRFGNLTLGQLTIDPGTVFEALAVFVLGLLAVRLFKRWLGEQLLPRTTLEPGMQNSLVTLLGYVGGVLVFALALAALNVSLQSIAWIASALSVGIGFGLQAIVQNFISGLILLAERPVKVGDWVSLSDVEGDIRRINVRATEIQMWDRSTVIVPNSQLITQNVRNVTLANAQGRVQIKLPMPLDTDARRARQIVLDAFLEHPAMLGTPAPNVQLEHVDTLGIHFVATGYVPSPRDVGGVRSDLLLAILERLRREDLPLIRPQDMRIHRLPDPGESG
jgi:potassium-dependent mechanosensitive channel